MTGFPLSSNDFWVLLSQSLPVLSMQLCISQEKLASALETKIRNLPKRYLVFHFISPNHGFSNLPGFSLHALEQEGLQDNWPRERAETKHIIYQGSHVSCGLMDKSFQTISLLLAELLMPHCIHYILNSLFFTSSMSLIWMLQEEFWKLALDKLYESNAEEREKTFTS